LEIWQLIIETIGYILFNNLDTFFPSGAMDAHSHVVIEILKSSIGVFP